MQLSDSLNKSFQAQFNVELMNADTYMALSIQAKAWGWDGFAKFFEKAACEEHEHAEGFAKFLLDRGRLPVMTKPTMTVNAQNVTGLMEAAYRLEQANTKGLYELYTLCGVEKDYEANIFLSTYLTEQRESEGELAVWIERLQRAGSGAALLLLDEKAGA